MRSRLTLNKAENVSGEKMDSKHLREKTSGREGREDLQGSIEGVEEGGERDEKQGEWQAFFSTLGALCLSESLPLKLVYLTFVWHFPSVPLLLRTAPQSGPLYASLPATKMHPEPLLQSEFPYTVTPTHLQPAAFTELTWLILSSIIFTFTACSNLKLPKLLWGNETLVGAQTCGNGGLLLLHEALEGPHTKVVC